MKLKRLFWASLALILLTSCASKPIPLAGDYQKTRQNIYNEYLVIADSYFELEKYDKAITYYKLCMEKRSLYWASYYKLAKCYAFQSNWEQALPMYKTIFKRDSSNDAIKASLAYIYAMEGDTKTALKMYNDLIQEHPENQEYLENYIAIQLLSNDLSDVEAPLALLKRDFPDSSNIEKFENQITKITEEASEQKDTE